MHKNPWLLVLLLISWLVWFWWVREPAAPMAELPSVAGEPASHLPSLPTPSPSTNTRLPAEAHHTIALIQRGGPYPHRQDGGVFGNRERRLPQKPRGWYREYTVQTPGLGHRGARRIVTGGRPPSEWYYTDDHYQSFRRFEASR